MNNITGGGARWLDVAPARYPGWIASFAARHGAGAADPSLVMTLTSEVVTFIAPDGAVAECHPPFPPFPLFPSTPETTSIPETTETTGTPATPTSPTIPAAVGAAAAGAVTEAIAAHALRPRTVGVLLVRLGGYAAGVFTGSPPRLAASKTGSRPVHGRSAAGGWSQHRFARRREKQASEALAAATDAAVAVFGSWGGVSRDRSESQITARGGHARGGPARGGHAGGGQAGGEPERGRGRLDAVVLGGDKRAMADLAADPRLAPYLALATDRFLTVPDPRRAVLEDTPRLFLAVRIRLTEPAP